MWSEAGQCTELKNIINKDISTADVKYQMVFTRHQQIKQLLVNDKQTII